jgi:hypothetical protein
MQGKHKHRERNASSFNSSIDIVEYVRGQFSSLSYINDITAREVHVLQIRKTFERAGIENELRFALKVLDLMREAQNLGNGYWYPTPLRVVPMDDLAILVSSLPTQELQRNFEGVIREGYARVIPLTESPDFPRQLLDDWLGLDVDDSVLWCERQIKIALADMKPTIPSGSVQFFTTRSVRSFFGKTTEPQWVKGPQHCLAWQENIILCRERIAAEYYRYFFGKVFGTRLTNEGPTLNNVSRVIFGFSALMGNPISVIIDTKNGGSVFRIATNLPRPEWQLLLALGVRDGKVFRVRCEAFVPIIAERLRRLGCFIRTIRD